MIHWYVDGCNIRNGLSVYHPSLWGQHRGGYLRFGRFQVYLRWSVKRRMFFKSAEWLPPRGTKLRPRAGWLIPKDWNDAQSLIGWKAVKKFGITIWTRRDE